MKITPNTANPPLQPTVLYRADTAGGTKTELSRSTRSSVWYFEDVRPISSGKKYYWIRAESGGGYTNSSYVGPVDAEPTDLGSDLET